MGWTGGIAEVFAELYVCWKCKRVEYECISCENCGGEMEFTYFVPEHPPTTGVGDVTMPSENQDVLVLITGKVE